MTSWNLGVFFTSSVSVWFTHPVWQPVLAARAAPTTSRCAQRFARQRASKREKPNTREHQRIDFSWQQSSQLDFYGDRLRQRAGSKQQPGIVSHNAHLSPNIPRKHGVGSRLRQKRLLSMKTRRKSEKSRGRKTFNGNLWNLINS